MTDLNKEELKTMIRFPAFHHAGKIYDLSHLDPSVVYFVQPGTDQEAAKVYKANVTFTQHCFTRALPRFGGYDNSLVCRDGREIRLFDVSRWELSKRLPDIVHTMAQRTCQHAKSNNFVTAEKITDGGAGFEYDVSFVASKATRPGFINLLIQSAYVRESKQTGKRVSFFRILHSALSGKKLRP